MSFEYVTNDGLVYDALFRHFRTSFIEHLRLSLIAAESDAAESKLRDAFGTEWQRISDKVRLSEAAGSKNQQRTDAFDLLDIAYFERIVDHFYSQIVPPEWLGTVFASSKNALITWIREIKSFRDPTAHPGDEPIELRDAMRAVDTARRILTRIGAVTDLESLQRIYDELLERAARPQEIGLTAPLDDSLPPAQTVSDSFVGRTIELRQLRAWLQLPRRNRWLLVGDGGKGKTSIAYAFASEVLEASPAGLCAVFWLSAKRRKYAYDRVLDIPTPDFSTLDECINRLLISYGHTAALDMNAEARREEILALLDELPCMLVVDDLDSVSEDNEDVIEFLTLDVAQTSTKVLFTSRRKFTGMGSSLTVITGLSEAESLEFIANRSSALGIEEDHLSLVERRRIHSVCDGSPLYMGDLLRLIASVGEETRPNRIIDDWRGFKGEEVRGYALQREMDMLTAPARRVLEALAISARAVTTQEVSTIVGLHDTVVLSSFDELSQLYLLSAPSLDEQTPRFQIEGNLAILVRADLAGTPRGHALTSIIESLEKREPDEGTATQIRDISRQARLLINSGRLNDAEGLLVRASADNPGSGHILSLLGFTYIAWKPRRNTDARIAFARAADLGFGDRGMYSAWSRIERELGNWKGAIRAALSGLENRSRDPVLLHALALSELGQAKAFSRALVDSNASAAFERADRAFDEALDQAIRLQLRIADISVMWREFVNCAVAQRDHKAVCRRLIRWNGWQSRDRELTAAVKSHRPNCPAGTH